MTTERWRRGHGWRVWAALACLGGLGLAAAVLLGSGGGEKPIPSLRASTEPAVATAAPSATLPSTSTPVPHYALLDGVAMNDAEWDARKRTRPLAVMIDNTAGGVPQAGLDQADLVYEAFVEGGITRFMAVFWRRDADLILPVRSARTPFVVWASELDALFAHAGGAQTGNEADAIAQIFEWKVRDLEAFAPGSSQAFHRIDDRFAPYNLATSSAELRKTAAQLGTDGVSTIASWRFADDRSRGSSGLSAGGIEISFRSQRIAADLIQWKWEPLANEYVRYQWGAAHRILPTLQPLRFKNVVVMRVPANVVDFSGHVVLEQFGEGPAQVFLDGLVVEAKWRKADREARTRYFDMNGREIAFNRGPIIIEVLGPGSLIVVTPTASGLPPMPEYQPPGSGLPEPDDTRPTSTPGPTATVASSATPLRTPSVTPSPMPPTNSPTPRPTVTPTPTPEVLPP